MTSFDLPFLPGAGDGGGDIYLTDAGVAHWESMLETLEIKPERWVDCPVLSALRIRYHPDGSGRADVRLQLTGPAEAVEVLGHLFPVGHIDRVELDEVIDGDD